MNRTTEDEATRGWRLGSADALAHLADVQRRLTAIMSIAEDVDEEILAMMRRQYVEAMMFLHYAEDSLRSAEAPATMQSPADVRAALGACVAAHPADRWLPPAVDVVATICASAGNVAHRDLSRYLDAADSAIRLAFDEGYLKPGDVEPRTHSRPTKTARSRGTNAKRQAASSK